MAPASWWQALEKPLLCPSERNFPRFFASAAFDDEAVLEQADHGIRVDVRLVEDGFEGDERHAFHHHFRSGVDVSAEVGAHARVATQNFR